VLHCDAPECYSTKKVCPVCGGKTELLRAVSFVDSPGHETLMATMICGASLMNGALLLIAANEQCPQPQTKEHLMALDIIGIRNIVIVQNKIDIVNEQQAEENYRQILAFTKGTVAEGAPIIPVSAHHDANLDLLIMTLEKTIPTPKLDLPGPPRCTSHGPSTSTCPGPSPRTSTGAWWAAPSSRARSMWGTR